MVNSPSSGLIIINEENKNIDVKEGKGREGYEGNRRSKVIGEKGLKTPDRYGSIDYRILHDSSKW